MARKSEMTESTEWGMYLRTFRLKTKTAKARGKGEWPLSMAAFATWLANHAGITISYSTYVSWEMGYREPADEVKARIREVLTCTPLPKGGKNDHPLP